MTLKHKKNKKNLMTRFVITDKKFRILVRITTRSSLICETVNVSAKSEITDFIILKTKRYK